MLLPSLRNHYFQAKIWKLTNRNQDYVQIGGVGSCQTAHATVTILIILSNQQTKVVTPQTPLCCISNTRFISHYHGASLLHWSYWICRLHSTQLTTLLFLIVSSHGLVYPISATDSKQLKLGQPSLNFVSCCFEYHTAQSLGLCCFPLYTTPLSKVIGMHPDIKYHFYADDTQLFIHMPHKNAALAFDRLNSFILDVQEWMLTSGSGRGGSGGLNLPPPLKNNGIQPKVQNYFLRVVLNLQEMHYIFTKKKFFLEGMPRPP